MKEKHFSVAILTLWHVSRQTPAAGGLQTGR